MLSPLTGLLLSLSSFGGQAEVQCIQNLVYVALGKDFNLSEPQFSHL